MAALVAVAAGITAGGLWLVRRFHLASPGPLTAHTGDGAVRLGVRSHAELEDRCPACHPPPGATESMSDLCLKCHDEIALQRRDPHALHSRLGDTGDCLGCHTDHGGRDAEVTHVSPATFPHESVGFALTGHARTRAGTDFQCEDCHPATMLRFSPERCAECHEDQPDFLRAHRAAWGERCLACHDGVDRFGKGRFVHPAGLPLTGGHARVGCERCHTAARELAGFAGLRTDCAGCHDAPADHGPLGYAGDCAACHTAESWAAARVDNHRFPLDHGADRPSACKTCHPATLRAYTCFGCHEHTPEGTLREHRHEVRAGSLADIADCARCHPTGREHEGEEGGRDDDDHGGRRDHRGKRGGRHHDDDD